jgi:hypothetical protein
MFIATRDIAVGRLEVENVELDDYVPLRKPISVRRGGEG